MQVPSGETCDNSDHFERCERAGALREPPRSTTTTPDRKKHAPDDPLSKQRDALEKKAEKGDTYAIRELREHHEYASATHSEWPKLMLHPEGARLLAAVHALIEAAQEDTIPEWLPSAEALSAPPFTAGSTSKPESPLARTAAGKGPTLSRSRRFSACERGGLERSAG